MCVWPHSGGDLLDCCWVLVWCLRVRESLQRDVYSMLLGCAGAPVVTWAIPLSLVPGREQR